MDYEVTMSKLAITKEINEDLFDEGFIIKNMTSIATYKIACENLKNIGEIQEIIHIRKRNEVEYWTIIKGKENKMSIISGFSSGYNGTGSTYFRDFLINLGVETSEANKVFEPEHENAVIKIKKVM